MKDSMITTAPELAGYKIETSLGTVTGTTVRSTSRMSEWTAMRQSLAGGDNSVYTQVCLNAYRESVLKMYTEAVKLGANAIVSVRYKVSGINSLAEVLSYGTAVIVKPKSKNKF